MGWNYVFSWVVVLPLELSVCGLTVQYWNQDISIAVWITVFLVLIVIINIFGAIGYAEEEFWASTFKLIATCVFMIIAFVLVLGGGPKGGRYDEYWGARYWYDPGAFKNGFKGFCSVFVTAAFSFSGTELVGLAAAESKNPVKSLPGAIKQVFWRITLFYILGLFFVGLLVDSNDKDLLSGKGANASPFVLAGKYAGLKGFDHFMNLVILVSVLSIGVSGVYGGSRTLTALAQQGYAPKIFTMIDKSGRPLPSVLFVFAWGPLAYVNLASAGDVVFSWLSALSGLAALFTWGSICYAHIRFRKAWLHQGHTLDEIPFKAAGGVIGSWIGIGIIVIVLMAQVSCLVVFPAPRAVFANTCCSFMSPSLLSARSLAALPTSSTLTSLFLSLPCSGLSATSGSVRVTSESIRLMSIPAVASSTGTRSTPTVPRLLPTLLGSAFVPRCSKCRHFFSCHLDFPLISFASSCQIFL